MGDPIPMPQIHHSHETLTMQEVKDHVAQSDWDNKDYENKYLGKISIDPRYEREQRQEVRIRHLEGEVQHLKKIIYEELDFQNKLGDKSF